MTAEVTVMLASSFVLEYSTNGGTSYNEIKNILDFNSGSDEAEEVDVTNFSSPNDRRQFKPSFKSFAEGSWTMQYLLEDTHHIAIRDRVGNPTAIKLRATTTAVDGDGEICTFDAIIRSWDAPRSIGEALTVTVGFRATGSITYTAPA